MNSSCAQVGFLSPCDTFKKQPVFLLILLRKQDKQSNNDHAFSRHFFLNGRGAKICALWGIQYPVFAPNFSSNRSLFLISCEVSFHLLWPALQLMILSAFRVSPLVFLTFVPRMPREAFEHVSGDPLINLRRDQSFSP